MKFIFIFFILISPLEGYRVITDAGRKQMREGLKSLLSDPAGVQTMFQRKIKLILRKRCIRKYGQSWQLYCE